MHSPASAALDIPTQARLLVFNPWVMLGGQAIYFAVLALIWLFFRPVVPAPIMNWWLAVAGVLVALVLAFDAMFFLRRQDSQELLRFWLMVDKKQTMLFDALAVAVIWLLLPYGGEAHRIVIVAFCVGYVPVQMISDPENAFGNKLSIITVLGSFAAYLLLQGGLAMNILTVMVVLYGLVLFYSADAFRRVVIDSLLNQREMALANQRLEAALSEVSAARDTTTRFIAAATHDLGQPLQAARLFAETALKARTIAERGRLLERALSALGSGQAMLGQMLYHLRLEADAVDPHYQRVRLDELVSRVMQQYDQQAQLAGMAIRQRCAPLTIESDPVLLERALGNLLHNAITHSAARRVHLIGGLRDGGVYLVVSDNGRGVPAPEQQLIFEDYRQGSRAGAGFGLGLGSARRLIALLGGELTPLRRRRGASFAIALKGAVAR